MTTLASAMLSAAQLAVRVYTGTATGGSTTTLIDTARAEPDTFFNNGTIFFLGPHNTGKSAIITDYDLATTKFTFALQSQALASGDKYVVIDKEIPRDVLIQSVNQALEEIGNLSQTDISLISVADQERYTLPTGVSNIKYVDYSYETTDPYDWISHHNWIEQEGQIIFDPGQDIPYDDCVIQLTYKLLQFTALDDDTDDISDLIPADLLLYTNLKYLLRWMVINTAGKNDILVNMLNEATLKSENAMRNKPDNLPRTTHFANY